MRYKAFSVVFLSSIFLFFSYQLLASDANKASKIKNQKHKESLSLTDADLAYREYMQLISRQLGVTCDYCHDVNNFKSPTKIHHSTAKQHMEIVKWLNLKGFSGPKAPAADCYMCHRGQAKPDYKEKVKISQD